MTEQEIFFEAMDIPDEAARAVFVERACGPDSALLQKVRELLEEHFSAETLLATGAVQGLRPAVSEFTAELEGPGSQIGRYKLLQPLGEGGFGIVYMAEQKEPVKRRVALKIIKLGMDTRQVVARFEAERQALALMEHPNIAKVLDAGATETGRPYFVMELVRGVPITKYCDDNGLNTRDRLLLFISVCNAIQHAHQKGIIHRDIKPSNVLVTLHDGVPVPKVIDFGIAKATQQEMTEKTLFTQFHQFIGTPAYMSPEQAEMSGLDIDTRSDVYSLGVLLYELLVGRTPLDSKALLSGGYDEIRRRIKEEEPPKPSTRISTLQGEDRTGFAKVRGIAPEQLSSELRGDLDWIVLKALEKDRRRRYETANGFAMDIRRFLEHDPVLAAPPDRAYLLRKYVRRHRASLSVALVVMFVLIAGSVVSGWQAWRANQARRAEVEQRELAEARQRKAEAAERRADEAANAARAAEGEVRRTLYASQMLLASSSWEKNNPTHLRKLLLATAEDPERGPEWFFWQHVCRMELQSLKAGFASVDCLQFSADDMLLASGDSAGSIVIWNVNSGERIHTLPSQGNEITSLAFSDDGKLLASGDKSGRLKLWNAINGRETAEKVTGTNRVTCIRFSPDSTEIAACSILGELTLWKSGTGTTKTYPGDPNADLSWKMGRRFTAVGPDFRTLVSGFKFGDFVVRDRERLVPKAGFPALDEPGYLFSAHGQFSRDGSRIILTALSGRVDVIDGHSLKQVGRLRTPEISSMGVSPDGSLIGIGTYSGRTAELWNLDHTNLIASFKGHPVRIQSVAVAGSGRIFASGDIGGDIKVWSADPRREAVRVKGGKTSLRVACFSRDGQRVLTADWRNQTTVWDAATGRQLHHFETAAPGAFFPDNRRLVTTSGGWTFGENGPLQIMDLETEKRIGVIATTNCITVDVSPDGKRVLAVKGASAAEIWNVDDLRLQLSVSLPSTRQLFGSFSPDASLAVTGGENSFSVWSTATGKILRTVLTDALQRSVASAAFSPDGKWIVCGYDNGSLTLWDIATGARLRDIEFHAEPVMNAGFSPDGRRVISCSRDGTTKLWDVATGRELFSIRDPSGSVVRATMSLDGRRLLHASSEEDAMVTIWTLGTPEESDTWVKKERQSASQARQGTPP